MTGRKICMSVSLRNIQKIDRFYNRRKELGGTNMREGRLRAAAGIMSSGIVMLLLPWLAVRFVNADGQMAVCFILFFAVNPIYMIGTGIFAGQDIKGLWHLPVVSSVLFLLGVWIFFDMGETAFIIYAVGYLVLGILSMAASGIIRKRRSI